MGWTSSIRPSGQIAVQVFEQIPLQCLQGCLVMETAVQAKPAPSYCFGRAKTKTRSCPNGRTRSAYLWKQGAMGIPRSAVHTCATFPEVCESAGVWKAGKQNCNLLCNRKIETNKLGSHIY